MTLPARALMLSGIATVLVSFSAAASVAPSGSTGSSTPKALMTRYAAVDSFFLEGLGAATERLRNFIQKAGQATLVGDVFDDAATGQGLLNYFLRGLNCGAITESEALATGLTVEELRSRSFVKILRGRRATAGR